MILNERRTQMIFCWLYRTQSSPFSAKSFWNKLNHSAHSQATKSTTGERVKQLWNIASTPDYCSFCLEAWRNLRYLGETIRSQTSRICEINVPQPLRTIQDDHQNLNSSPTVFVGWSRVINTLPRITSIKSVLALQIPQGLFQEIDAFFSSFLWEDKRPRINRINALKAKLQQVD